MAGRPAAVACPTLALSLEYSSLRSRLLVGLAYSILEKQLAYSILQKQLAYSILHKQLAYSILHKQLAYSILRLTSDAAIYREIEDHATDVIEGAAGEGLVRHPRCPVALLAPARLHHIHHLYSIHTVIYITAR